ncbi:thiamine pyrophosphate-dependent enzyme [Bordetella genomosp. 13]|uniref:thiamine pyrophosphate-dependent enzyme n=1 Tax=Bordetella genomosp. 13 TaxID=463040 RepID=UPI0011A23F6C|nr:thiamine pyrophosphate-dependent enzyme [Bordetella genomosp. 13]
MTEHTKPVLDRRAAVARILRDRGQALAIASLGNPTYDLAAAGDCDRNFYLWGAMGGAVMVGLGLAQAQPDHRVIVFVGDGEMMMGLGSLATAAVKGAANLSVVVIDNEHYAETGMQPAHAGRGVDIPAVARACGFSATLLARTEADLEAAAEAILHGPGPVLASIKVGTEPQPTVLPPRDGPYLRSRFRAALLGDDAHR